MGLNKERAFYKAVSRSIQSLNTQAELKAKLEGIIRLAARASHCAVSLLLMDTAGQKLSHNISFGLPQFYLHKGVLSAAESIGETAGIQAVSITDAQNDSRIQFPQMAAKAGFSSILGSPVIYQEKVIGSLRFYCKDSYEFSQQDINFAENMARIISLAFGTLPVSTTSWDKTAPLPASDLKTARNVTFAHQSEAEFARLLDFYNIEWIYEPRSFPLSWKGEQVTEMFTPDFYLPGMDMYIELTTLKQSLVTTKNHKLKLLRELYPDIKISLLYKNDYARLLAKYGCGPLAQTRAHGIDRVLYTAQDISERVSSLARQISDDYRDSRPILIGVQRGFICFMADLIRQIAVPLDIDFMTISYYSGSNASMVRITKDMDLEVAGRDVLLVEDIVDTGITLNYLLNHLRSKNPASLKVCTLLDRKVRRLIDIKIDYVGFELPDEFVVGYGLDYHEEYRNLPFIGIPGIKETSDNKP
ncbi:MULTISPECIES: hypoxanthine phosphoribosyltransferase [Dehalococcoides]|uniref:hypoxanthine phosphoribosyltransferase n=1 Tax=Dehalococcoides TaxID=61434 RepID=UPI000BBA5630|nr:hypoxanthine phosphoribosyltransferase [Dehalococcoides sp.]MEA4879310.1 hypoxanthine phosphoribosyltransferase [Dehalococcoides mccartyi]